MVGDFWCTAKCVETMLWVHGTSMAYGVTHCIYKLRDAVEFANQLLNNLLSRLQ